MLERAHVFLSAVELLSRTAAGRRLGAGNELGCAGGCEPVGFPAGLQDLSLTSPQAGSGPDTLFPAASNTKAMTTLLLAELVDERKLQWDEPVTEVYPDFRLGDADTTRQVLVKHLVCACTGLPRQDFEWLFNFGTATPASSLASLGTMQPTSRFGEVFQYSNLMAAAAGYIAASVARPKQELGAAYDEVMRSKAFEPLGMTHTTFDFSAAMSGNFASPHGSPWTARPHRPGWT